MKIELTLEEVKDIEDRLNKFILKVENKEARSRETYADAKAIVALLKRKKEDLFKYRLIKTVIQ